MSINRTRWLDKLRPAGTSSGGCEQEDEDAGDIDEGRRKQGSFNLVTLGWSLCEALSNERPAEVPTQTTERVEKALMTLQSIERFACD